MERHISVTLTMSWEIYYVHLQSAHVDTLHQAAAGCLAAATVCSGKNLRTNMHGQMNR